MARNDLIELVKIDRNGTKVFRDWTCDRCGGMGESDKWMFTGRTCFACGGTGRSARPHVVKEYTPEYWAKLEARREAERLAEIERNRGHFIGEIGDKIEMTVSLDHEFSFSRPCYGAPWKKETVNGYVWKTDDGNTLVWLTAGNPLCYHTKEDGCPVTIFPEDGERMTIKATIKEHREYDDVNQTMLTRVKWIRG